MSSPNLATEVKWPNVPACFGWLSLDRRGNWRLKGEVVRHAGLVAFINRNYGADDEGRWVFQNGPQAVYVALEYTPLIFRFDSGDRLRDHTETEAGDPSAVWIDDEGSVLILARRGIGLLDDRDLAEFLDACSTGDGKPATENGFVGLSSAKGAVFWRGLPVQFLPRCEVAPRFGFNPLPSG